MSVNLCIIHRLGISSISVPQCADTVFPIRDANIVIYAHKILNIKKINLLLHSQ